MNQGHPRLKGCRRTVSAALHGAKRWTRVSGATVLVAALGTLIAPSPPSDAAAAAATGSRVMDAESLALFRSPPVAAAPHVIWNWSEGELSRQRLDRDVEAMRKAGFGGALIEMRRGRPTRIAPEAAAPQEPLDDLVAHAAAAARRAGLELGVSLHSGGSPSVLPAEELPRKLTWSSTRLQSNGTDRVAAKLPPPDAGGTYEEIVVLAGPTPPPAAEPLAPVPGAGPSLWPRDRAIDVSTHMKPNGLLEWEAPPGFWNLLRIGSTTTNAAPNWRPRFRDAFRQRLGYDPTPFLPIAAGFGDADADIERRFLVDMQSVLADEFRTHEGVAGRTYASQRGLTLLADMSEGMTGNPHLHDPELATVADIPLANVRLDGAIDGSWRSCVWASSAGRLHGRPVIAARAVVAWTSGASGVADAGRMPPAVAAALCAGVNRIYLPADGRDPAFGRSFSWRSELARCQWLLQRGQPVADFCMLDVDGVIPPSEPLPGHRVDWCPAVSLADRLRVEDGLVVAGGGGRYRALVLPAAGRIAPLALETVRDLARAGATVGLTARPSASPSLEGHPACDAAVESLAKELCGDAKPPASGARELPCGRGRVILLSSLADLPAAMKLQPDAVFAGDAGNSIHWVHRRTSDADVYFVANLADRAATVTGTFRIAGPRPRVWDPATGDVHRIDDAAVGDATTRVPLTLAAGAGLFVCFEHSQP